ncbi:MAG TPA: hypothetical protein VHB72_04545 [Candidatus Saccharimonadales bacterium]|nr:hypothetical protein [Candidatus Saccharimonadales bacterium]
MLKPGTHEYPHVCVRTTDHYFLVATSQPFEENTQERLLFDEFSCQEPRTLSEGSQVYIYDRAAWGANGDTDVIDYIKDVIGPGIGGIMLEPIAVPSALTMQPYTYEAVGV